MAAGEQKPPALPFTPKREMFPWLAPRGLLSLAGQVLLAGIFGARADRRDMEAVLSPVADNRGDDSYGADDLWFDFVADIGDGFDATYTVANLLAQQELTIGAETLPRGRLLVMGGDECYPLGTSDRYRNQTTGPYALAFPTPADETAAHPDLFVIPGNHDWYDGLKAFLQVFTRSSTNDDPGGARVWVGGWEVKQRRSYFARRLTDRWWLWGIDTQLGVDLDQPQLEYFHNRSFELRKGESIILLAPTPSWVHACRPDADGLAYAKLREFEQRYIDPSGAELRLLLTGDDHHYAHYLRDDGVHAFTAGGGGAYSSDTHHLPKILRPEYDEGSATDTFAFQQCWPTREESQQIAKHIWRLPALNRGFIGLAGTLYLLLAMAAGRVLGGGLGLTGIEHDSGFGEFAKAVVHDPFAWVLMLTFGAALYGFAGRTGWRRASLGVGHVAAHLLAAWVTIRGTSYLTEKMFDPTNTVKEFALAIITGGIIVIVGGFVGSEVMAMYLYLADRLAYANSTELFSALQGTNHKHFLRLHITGEEVSVYPIGVTQSGKYLNADRTGLRPGVTVEPQLFAGKLQVKSRRPAPDELILDPERTLTVADGLWSRLSSCATLDGDHRVFSSHGARLGLRSPTAPVPEPPCPLGRIGWTARRVTEIRRRRSAYEY
jgi:Calcineurin-like phosphoesterase